jgi:hypothetical protein
MDRFSKAAILFMYLNAFGAVVFFSKTEFFPVAAFGVAINLLIHGVIVHFPLSEFQDSMHSYPAFRVRYVCNHETWVLVATTAGLVSALGI